CGPVSECPLSIARRERRRCLESAAAMKKSVEVTGSAKSLPASNTSCWRLAGMKPDSTHPCTVEGAQLPFAAALRIPPNLPMIILRAYDIAAQNVPNYRTDG